MSRTPVRERLLSGFTWPGTAFILVLAGVGFLAVWSASYRSAEFGRGYYLDFYQRQLIWIAAGVVVFAATLIPRRKTISGYAYLSYALLLLMVISVIFLGKTINGSRRWIVLGPLNVQPSEFMKLGVILALGRYLGTRPRLDRFRDLILPFAIVLLPMAFIIRQPDLGTSLLLVPILMAMLYVAGAKARNLAIILVVMASLAPLSYAFLLKDYQKKRVDAFIGQGRYTEDQKIGEAYQLIQSKVAVGSGGSWGKGWRKGTQNLLNFTPFRHTDFIFAVIGEEWGFGGTVGILALFLLIFSLSISLAMRTAFEFDRLIITGTVTALGFQLFINTAMAVGLAPITGLTLPFISYGGSSMVMSFASMGLIAGARINRTAPFSLSMAPG